MGWPGSIGAIDTTGKARPLVTSIGRRIGEQRENLILAQAAPYLEADERVLSWVRGRKFRGRGEGFVFVTPRRVIVHWTGRNDAPGSFEWSEVTGWGISSEAKGGPVLAIESGDEICTVQLRSTTKAMGDRVASFVEEFASLVPSDRQPTYVDSSLGAFQPTGSLVIPPHLMSTGDKMKRIGITILGATLVFGGLILTPLPGPWSFPIVIAGLAVLAQEYDWAKDAREWVRAKSRAVANKFKHRPSD
ncbi:MAG: PGPGW domain-containing protein [Actinobacteria bacterium]|nr:PGPGW domain-containing protein [Actinomycetota bacterium]